MFALPSFTARGSDASAASGGYSELSEWQRSARCKSALSGAASAGHRNRIYPNAQKSLHISVEAYVFALPIFTASHPATIVGVHVLNFCVRDGNRWTHMTINTNFW